MTLSFQSTHPVWDGTFDSIVKVAVEEDFNPPIPCGMGPNVVSAVLTPALISIHPSRVGWDSIADNVEVAPDEFQSTHPVWDGTFSTYH